MKKMGFALLASMVLCSSAMAAEDICMRDGICPSPSKKLWPTGGKTQTPNLILARKIDYNNDCNPRLPPFIV